MPTVATQASDASASYIVVAPAPGSAQTTPTSSVAATTADPVPADNVASTQITLNNALTADLSTTIVGPASAAAAQPLQYFLTTTNNGPGQAQNVVQSVAIPAGLPIVGVNAVRINGNVPTSISGTMASYGTGATAATYDAAAGLVNIPIATGVTGPGTSVVNSVAYNVPVNDGNLVNVAAVRATSLDNAAANNTAQVVSTVQPQADVQVLIAGPTSSTVGAPVTFVVTTTNLGPSIVPTQTISVQLPSTLTSGSGVVEVRDNAGNIQPGAVYNNTNGTVTLPAITNQSNGTGAAVRFTISFLTPAGSVFSPTARTSVPGTLDPILGNNEASVSVSVSPATPIRPDLSTSFAAGTSTSATAGQPVTLVVQTANAAGMPTATNVVQDVMLIGGLTTTGLTVGGIVGAFNATTGLLEFAVTNGTATYSPSTGLLSIPINSLIAGASTTTSIVLPAPGSSLLAVTAAVHGAQSDAVTTNNRATIILPITSTVGVQTTVAGPISAPLGSMVTYSIVTTNNGPSDAANVVQTAILPAGATNVVISGGGTQSGDVVTFPMIATLVPGTTGLITNSISFTVPNTTPSITVTGNVTAIGDNTPGGNNTSNQVTATQPNRPPVASDVVNTIQSPLGNTAVMKVAMSTLLATDVDGNPTVVTYTLTSFPSPATVGTLYVNGVAVTAPRTLTTVEVSQLSFLPKAGFVGNMFFTYTVTDNGNGNAAQALTSNVARYTLQVGQDVNSVYTRPTTTKGGNANKYVAGDVLAYGIDPNTAQYNSVGLIYDVATGAAPTTGIGSVNNGIRVAKISVADSTTLAAVGIRFTRATALFTVFNPALLPRAGVTLPPITVTSLDRNGGVNTNAVVLVTGASPLPVELTEFTAQAVKNIDAQLAWRTASEKNNDHFDAERSIDGATFVKIGQVKGQGTILSSTAYALTDAGIGAKASGQVYYRLKQVDIDGTATYSPVRTVTFIKSVTPAISLFPNPATTDTNLDLTQLPTGTYQVSVLDATGRVVLGLTLEAGLAHALDLNTIASGTYMVMVRGQNSGQAILLTKRFIKE